MSGRDRRSCFHSSRFCARCGARIFRCSPWCAARRGQRSSFYRLCGFTSFLYNGGTGRGYTTFSKCVTHYDTFNPEGLQSAVGSPRGLPGTSSRCYVPMLPEGRCPCYLRIAPRQGVPFEKGSLHPAESSAQAPYRSGLSQKAVPKKGRITAAVP